MSSTKTPRSLPNNKRFIELLGFEDGTIKIGLPWTKVVQATAKLGAYGAGNQKQILNARKHSHREKFDTDELTFPDGTVLAIKRRELAGGGFVSTFRDITRRRKRTAELQLALENLRKLTEIQNAILNALPSNIALLDDNAAVIAINKSWRGFANRHRLTAGAREGGNYVLACEYASGPFATVGTKIANGVRAVLSGKRRRFSCEYPFTDAGKERWFLMVSVPVGNGDIHGAIVSHTDITEQKRLQRNVIASEEHLRAIVESTGEAILTLRDDGTIASANTMTTTLFVYANKKTIGKHVTNLLPEFPFFQSISGIPGGTPPFYQGEMMGIRADGNRFSTDVLMTLAKSPAGDFYVLAIRDTTSQRTLQEELIQASKLSTLGEMAAGMAHELNQPLNVIRMSADNAAMRLERGAAQENYLQETLNGIGDQAAKLGKMILDLRIISRREEHSDKLNFIPTEVAGAACRLMRGQLNIDSIDIIESYSESCRAVQGSGNQLEQVIINLLSNARDAILELRTKTSSTSRGVVTVNVNDPGTENRIKIAVEDTGSGIPDEVMSKIFNPFFTTKIVGAGTGLGLSISYGIITSLKGSIIAKNTKTGALMEIKLPAIADQDGASSTHQEEKILETNSPSKRREKHHG